MTLWVALEGSDGAGKSKHSEALVERLNADGARAIRWAHPRPPEGCRTDRSRTLWYALQRSLLLDTPPTMPDGTVPDVVVLDRWVWSNVVAVATAPAGIDRHMARSIVEAERAVLAVRCSARVILLHAPMAMLIERHEARGETPPPRLTDIDREYATLANDRLWPTVNTGGSGVDAAEEIYQIVRRWLP